MRLALLYIYSYIHNDSCGGGLVDRLAMSYIAPGIPFHFNEFDNGVRTSQISH